MTEYDDRILQSGPRKAKISHFRPAAYIVIPLIAILFQVYVPRFVDFLSYLELPLLVVVYFSLMRRQPVAGAVIGTVIGLAQDSLSQHPLGMFGIVKTLVGYFSASISMRFDVENNALRFILSFFFFLFHQFFFWVLARGLLGRNLELQIPQSIIFAFLNAVVAVPLFLIMDKLRVEEQ
ncbi:rod shape-determining protein MreD [Paludibaculum fermentans]|uniref:rod shape-determining protein MreD n=1 Tax=Paludibaculum fermentans TaxID=1473598 RepID=UPI003EBF5447